MIILITRMIGSPKGDLRSRQALARLSLAKKQERMRKTVFSSQQNQWSHLCASLRLRYPPPLISPIPWDHLCYSRTWNTNCTHRSLNLSLSCLFVHSISFQNVFVCLYVLLEGLPPSSPVPVPQGPLLFHVHFPMHIPWSLGNRQHWGTYGDRFLY